MTGEFPPKKESVKAQYLTLLEFKNNLGPLLKTAAEKLRASKTGDPVLNAEEIKTLLMRQGNNSQDLNAIIQEQIRLKTQLDVVIQQNNEIIKLLNKNPKQ